MPRIAALPGDGIGPEVVTQGLRVLEALDRQLGLDLDVTTFPLSATHYLETGETLPQSIFERLRDEFDAIYVGAFGDPRVPGNEHARDILLGLRFRLDLYVNLRPIRLLAEDLGPLKGRGPADIDFAIFRENTEGLYLDEGRRDAAGTPDEVAVNEMRYSYRGVERILRAAFEYAQRHGKSRVCMSDKSNAVRLTGSIWQRAFGNVSAEFPDIEPRHLYIDALCMELVRAPQQFDVIVTGNLFGDILSDLGAQLMGGIGLAASANLHPGRHGLFEPVHGSAPNIAGQGRANPIGAVASAAHLLRFVELDEAAAHLEAALSACVTGGTRTPDLGGSATTVEVTDDILRRL